MEPSKSAIIFGKWFFASVVMVSLLGSCDPKELPMPKSEDPIFYFAGEVDGQPQMLEAGEADFFMFTDYETRNNRQRLTGELRQENCTNCGPALEISFLLDQGASLQAGEQEWQYQEITQNDWRTIQFEAIGSNDPSFSHHWDFGDGQTSNATNPVHAFAAAGTYNVCLTIKNDQDCRSTICNDVIIDSVSCNASFVVNHQGNKTIELQATKPDNAQYQWELGDGNTANGTKVQHTYEYYGYYEVCLTATGANGCQSTVCREISARQGNACTAGYNYGLARDTAAPASGVQVKWTGANGQSYTSTRFKQPSSDLQMEIIELNEYEPNQDDQPTQRVTFTLDAFLYNTTDPDDSISILTDTFSNGAVGYQP